jgi:hypothetical protein
LTKEKSEQPVGQDKRRKEIQGVSELLCRIRDDDPLGAGLSRH